MLEINEVTKIYKGSNKKALDNISFKIGKGGFVGLLGQNGAGKSTLINILAGNVKKDKGKIIIDGFDFDKHELYTKRIIGIVPQEISFDHFFTVNEVLENQSGYFGIKNNKKYINELLDMLSLMDKKNVNTKELSGGMKRRLLIAKALVHKPKLLILDEPTAGVDIELRHSLYSFLKKLNNTGITIILTTHYIEEAEKLCDRIIIINYGKIVIDDSKEKIINSFNKEIFLEFTFNNNSTKNNFNFLKEYFPVMQDNNKLRVMVTKNNIIKIFKELEEQNIEYSNLKIENKKLEDFFLNIIKN